MATDAIGQGVIELKSDSTQFKAGIEDAKKSINSLGKATDDALGGTKNSRSIDRYVSKLQLQAAVTGKTARETELYSLKMRGASVAQLAAADSALKLVESHNSLDRTTSILRNGFIAVAAAAATAAVAIAVGAKELIGQVGNYQDLGEKIGDTGRNISSMKTAADVAGISLDTIAVASVKLTAALSKTDDESLLVGAGIKALGINFDDFKKMSPVEQIDATAKGFEKLADGSEKTAIATAIYGRAGADLLGFLREYSGEGLNAAYVTDAQVEAADAAADATAAFKSEIQKFLQVAAVDLLPVMQDVKAVFEGVAGEEDKTSIATDIVKGGIAALVVVFQTLVGVGSDVVFVFKGVGRELGAVMAQAGMLAKLDFKGFDAISAAVREDGVKARKELDAFQARLFAVNEPKFKDPRILGVPTSIADQARKLRPKGNISGLNQDKPTKTPRGSTTKPKVDNSIAQEAKSQLAFDLAQIKQTQDAIVESVGNAQKLMEAKRAAGLMSEGQYYAARRGFSIAHAAAQEQELQAEINRMQQENLTGKDRINNDRKIIETQTKLTSARETAATALEVLKIQEVDALADIARGYVDAREAAQSYLDTMEKAQRREAEGMGKGNRARALDEGLNQIDDKYATQRQDLQRDNRNGKFVGREKDYQKELALIDEFNAKSVISYKNAFDLITAQQGDFMLGAQEALANYFDQSQNTFEQINGVITNAFGGAEDALTDFVTKGKGDFRGLVDSIISDLARMAIKQAILGPLSSMLGSVLGMPFGGGRASGGGVSGGKFYEVGENNNPEMFKSQGKNYLIPGNDGDVTPGGGGGGTKTVTIAPSYTINIDGTTDKSVIYSIVERGIRAGNAKLIDDLQIAGRL